MKTLKALWVLTSAVAKVTDEVLAEQILSLPERKLSLPKSEALSSLGQLTATAVRVADRKVAVALSKANRGLQGK